MCWHKWTKWEEYIFEAPIFEALTGRPFAKEKLGFSERRQQRECKKCGKPQDRKVD